MLFLGKKNELYCLMKKQQHIKHTNTVALKNHLQKVKSIKNFFLFFFSVEVLKVLMFPSSKLPMLAHR